MGRKKACVIAAATAIVGAFVPTLIVLKMIADNNNNGEIYDIATGQWDVGYALSFSAIFYVPSFLLIFAIAFGFARLWDDSAD
jgi:hypothetical protein